MVVDGVWLYGQDVVAFFLYDDPMGREPTLNRDHLGAQRMVFFDDEKDGGVDEQGNKTVRDVAHLELGSNNRKVGEAAWGPSWGYLVGG
eukprot:4847205-Amphidinium_carterae.1